MSDFGSPGAGVAPRDASGLRWWQLAVIVLLFLILLAFADVN